MLLDLKSELYPCIRRVNFSTFCIHCCKDDDLTFLLSYCEIMHMYVRLLKLSEGSFL